MSHHDSGCIDEVVQVATTQSNNLNGTGFTEKFNNDSIPATSSPTPIPTSESSVPPPRSTFKSIVLVLTVTFSMIINVGSSCLAAVVHHTRFSKLIIIGGEKFGRYNSPTNDSERVGHRRSKGSVDRVGFLFDFGR